VSSWCIKRIFNKTVLLPVGNEKLLSNNPK
jgi:hypothetical protein